MKDDSTIPSDEELTAYLDGELGGEDARRLEMLIAADERVSARLDFLASGGTLPFEAAFAPLLDEAPKARLEALLAEIPASRPAAPAVLRSPGRRRFVAAIAASLLAGIVIDRGLLAFGRASRSEDEGSHWRAVVAQYIALYTAETLAGPPPTRQAQETELARLEQQLGLALTPEFVSLPAAGFSRAQVLRYDEQPLGQIAYLDPLTGPIALCIVRSEGRPAAPEMEVRKGMNVVYWSTATHAYMLVGHASAERMSTMARDVAARLSI